VAGRLSSGKNAPRIGRGICGDFREGWAWDIFGTRSEFDFFVGDIRGFHIITIKAKVLLLLYIHSECEYDSFIGCTFADDLK
jgi:hypothetical protein